jgi:hypothetical protein
MIKKPQFTTRSAPSHFRGTVVGFVGTWGPQRLVVRRGPTVCERYAGAQNNLRAARPGYRQMLSYSSGFVCTERISAAVRSGSRCSRRRGTLSGDLHGEGDSMRRGVR